MVARLMASITSAPSGSKDLNHEIVMELSVLSSYQKSSWILVAHHDYRLDFAKLALPQPPAAIGSCLVPVRPLGTRWKSTPKNHSYL